MVRYYFWLGEEDKDMDKVNMTKEYAEKLRKYVDKFNNFADNYSVEPDFFSKYYYEDYRDIHDDVKMPLISEISDLYYDDFIKEFKKLLNVQDKEDNKSKEEEMNINEVAESIKVLTYDEMRDMCAEMLEIMRGAGFTEAKDIMELAECLNDWANSR